MFQQATNRTVDALQAFWHQNNYEDINGGVWVPTLDKYPVVVLRDGIVVMAHGDFSEADICRTQLPGVIAGYERLLADIDKYSASPAVAFMQATRNKLWSILAGYALVATEEEASSPIDAFVHQLAEQLGGRAKVIALGGTGFPDLGEDQEFFELVVEQLGFKPTRLPKRLQLEFIADFARYAELVHKLLLVQLKIEQVNKLIAALKREQKNRETAQKLWDAERKIIRNKQDAEIAQTQADARVLNACIQTATDILMAFGAVTLSDEAIKGAVPEIAADVLAEVLHRKANASTPDWLSGVELPENSPLRLEDEPGDDVSDWLTEVEPPLMFTGDPDAIGGGRDDLLVEQPVAENAGAPDLDGEGLTGNRG